MAYWVQVVLTSAALAVALGVLWTKIVHPIARFISDIDKLLPLIRDLLNALGGTPHAFHVLDEIIAQFRTNSGSSLKDSVNRLEHAAEQAQRANETLTGAVTSAKELAVLDHAQLQELHLLLDRLTERETIATRSRERVEQTQEHIVTDLAESHRRADEADSSVPGAAADAASQSDAGIQSSNT